VDGFDIRSPHFAHLIVPNAPLETLAVGFRWIEGLVWIADANCLLFQDLPRDRTMRWIEDAGVSIFRSPSGFANGQTRDREGRLIACSHRERCLFRTEHDGRITRLVDRFDGRRLNAPNDVVVKSDGTIWFTDPLYGIQSDYEGGRQASERPPAVFRFDPAANELTVVADEFDGPNGLAFSPDESRLYISETGDQTIDDPKQFIRVFDVDANGALHGGDIFHKIASTKTATSGPVRPTACTASIRTDDCSARFSCRIASPTSHSAGPSTIAFSSAVRTRCIRSS
jgi:gluconolactonase